MATLKTSLTTSQVDQLPTAIGGKAKFSAAVKLTGSGFVWDEATRTLEVVKLPYYVNLGPTGLRLYTWKGGGKTFCHWYRTRAGVVRQPPLGKRPVMSVEEAVAK